MLIKAISARQWLNQLIEAEWRIYASITLAIIGSVNGLSPGRRQAINWTNAGILLIRPPGTNFNEILIEIYAFSFTKIHLKMSSGKRRPFCLRLNVLKTTWLPTCRLPCDCSPTPAVDLVLDPRPTVVRLAVMTRRSPPSGTGQPFSPVSLTDPHQNQHSLQLENLDFMITPCHWSAFCIIDQLWREFGGFPSQRNSDAESWYFFHN